MERENTLNMKIDRERVLLERAIANSDFISARRIIEKDITKFNSLSVRKKLSLEALTLVNSVTLFNQEEYKDVFSRETHLIIQHINKLASNGGFQYFKRYCSLHDKLLSNPRIYSLLNLDAKALVPVPSTNEALAQ